MSKPTRVFIPGFWEGPTAYAKVLDILNSNHAFQTRVIPLSSTGTSPTDGKTFTSNITTIRKFVPKLADKGQEMILNMHTGGAFIGSQALQGLSLSKRTQQGKAGGVAKLVYLTGALLTRRIGSSTADPFSNPS